MCLYWAMMEPDYIRPDYDNGCCISTTNKGLDPTRRLLIKLVCKIKTAVMLCCTEF